MLPAWLEEVDSWVLIVTIVVDCSIDSLTTVSPEPVGRFESLRNEHVLLPSFPATTTTTTTTITTADIVVVVVILSDS